MIPYFLEYTNIPGLYKTRAWGTYRGPLVSEIIGLRVNSLVEIARIIFDARKDLPPETLKTRLNKIRFTLNYNFNRIFR